MAQIKVLSGNNFLSRIAIPTTLCALICKQLSFKQLSFIHSETLADATEKVFNPGKNVI